MFKCQKCNKISKSKERQYSFVIEKRKQIYTNYRVKVKGNRGKSKEITIYKKPDEKDKRIKLLKTFKTSGWEIVKEIKVCKSCFKLVKGDKQ